MNLTWIRAIASALLLIIGALAVSGVLAAYWLDTVLLDTETFVAAAEPLLADSAALDSTAERISNAILAQLDIRTLAKQIPSEFLQQAVEQLAPGFDTFVRDQVTAAVDSEGYAALARTRLRTWHLTFASAVTATGDGAVLEETTLSVTLGPYIDLLAEKTDEPILRTALELVPDSIRTAQVSVLDAKPFADRLPALQALHRAGPFLPWIAAVALLGGLLLAPRRGYALVGGGAALALSGGALHTTASAEAQRVAGLLGKTLGASLSVAEQAVGTLADPLLTWATWVMWVGVVLAIVGVALSSAGAPSGRGSRRGPSGS